MSSKSLELTPLDLEMNSSKDTLVVSIGTEMRDANWGKCFGKLQYVLRARKFGNCTFNRMFLDLQNCKWSDPTPLLSLSIALSEFESGGGLISGQLLSLDNADSKSLLFIKFLAQEGFLDLLVIPSPVTGSTLLKPELLNASISSTEEAKRTFHIGSDKLTREKVDELARLSPVLAYNNCTCLPAELIEVSDEPGVAKETASFSFDDIDGWVEDRLARVIGPVIVDKVPPWAQSDMLYRLQIFLREGLHNVLEHAYQSDDSDHEHHQGFAAVYIRFRHGLLGFTGSARLGIASLIKDETKLAPLMSRRYAEDHSGFFELFLVDAGRGLCESLGTIVEYPTNPIHQTMLDVFSGRRRGGAKETRYGGLILLKELLERHKDYIRVRDEDAWWGRTMPFPLKWPEGGKFFQKANGGAFPVKGLSWTVRLSWLDNIDLVDSERWFGWAASDRHPLLEELSESNTDIDQFKQIPIFDYRLSESVVQAKTKILDSPYALLLPKPRMMKNEVQHYLREVVRHSPLRKGGTIIIGDIPPDETPTYIAALEKAPAFSHDHLSLVNQVVLVTKNLRVCVLRRAEEELCFHGHATDSFVRCDNPMSLSPQKSLRHFFRVLRWHDSSRLWRSIHDHLTYEKTFFYGSIKWNEEKTLTEFLDFAQTLTDATCQSLYVNALSRLPGLFPRNLVKTDPLDSLVENLVVQFRAQLHAPISKYPHTEQSVSIGSVKVSGITERRADDNSVIIHILKHPQASHGQSHSLFLWPKATRRWREQFPRSNKSYARVGRTPVIAEGGWKAYPLFRFQNGESIYYRSPRESYVDWQGFSRTLMKLGHWKYGGHHDLVTINLLLAFNSELDRIRVTAEGSVAGFVIGRLMAYFGLIKDDLTDEGKRIFKAILEENQLDCPHEKPKQAHVVYASHPVTDQVVDRFLSLIRGLDNRNQIRRRMIGVLPARRARSGSTLLVSGLLLERLAEITDVNPNSPVLLFDDAVLTGRTYQEIKQLLVNNGFTRIDSLTLLDRQRLPDSSYIGTSDKKARSSYWRLDIPTLGHDGECALCNAISTLRQLASSVSKESHEQHIKQICDNWAPKNPVSEWSDGGVDSVPLAEVITKRFGINKDGRQLGGSDQKVQIRNSIGLVCYISELHSMTSRDDLAFDFMENYDLNVESRIHMLASQILLFGKEMDFALELELSEKLICILDKVSESNSHTNLALLALISRKPEIFSAVFISYQAAGNNLLANEDISLLVAYGLKVGWVEDKKQFFEAKKILKNEMSDPFIQFHREVDDKDGPAHQPALFNLKTSYVLDNPESAIQPSVESCERLLSLLDAIPVWRYRTPHLLPGGPVKSQINTCKEECKKFYENGEGLLRGQRHEGLKISSDQLDNLRNHAGLILRETRKLHERLFLTVGLQSIKDGKLDPSFSGFFDHIYDEAIINAQKKTGSSQYLIATKHEKSAKIRADAQEFKSSIREVYVLFDAVIEKALIDIFSNIHHAIYPIPSAFNTQNEGKLAHMWVELSPLLDHFEISLSNATNVDIRKIAVNGKRSRAYDDIGNIGGFVKYLQPTEKVVEVRIGLPYAHQVITDF